MINWQYYPKSDKAPELADDVVKAFRKVLPAIDSAQHTLESNAVLLAVRPHLEPKGFRVESGKQQKEKITVPVLFGRNGGLDKAFDADAYNEEQGFVIEVEAGRAVANNQFLKDFFQACMMHGVSYLAIAVRNTYRTSKDFDSVLKFFDALYASNRLQLPLKGLLIIGY